MKINNIANCKTNNNKTYNNLTKIKMWKRKKKIQLDQNKNVNQQQQQTLHDEFESHHDEGYQLAQNKDQNINKTQQQNKNL